MKNIGSITSNEFDQTNIYFDDNPPPKWEDLFKPGVRFRSAHEMEEGREWAWIKTYKEMTDYLNTHPLPSTISLGTVSGSLNSLSLICFMIGNNKMPRFIQCHLDKDDPDRDLIVELWNKYYEDHSVVLDNGWIYVHHLDLLLKTMRDVFHHEGLHKQYDWDEMIPCENGNRMEPDDAGWRFDLRPMTQDQMERILRDYCFLCISNKEMTKKGWDWMLEQLKDLDKEQNENM